MKKLNIEIIISNNGGEINYLRKDVCADNDTNNSSDYVKYTIFASRGDIDYISKYLFEICSELVNPSIERETVVINFEDGKFTIDEYNSIFNTFKNKYDFNIVEFNNSTKLTEMTEEENGVEITEDNPSETEDMMDESDNIDLEEIPYLSVRVFFESSKLTMVSDILEGGHIDVVINVTDHIIQWYMIKNEIETKILTTCTLFDFNENIVVDFIYNVIADPTSYHMIQQVIMMAVNSADLRLNSSLEDEIILPHFALQFNSPDIYGKREYYSPSYMVKKGNSFDDFISSFENESNNSSGESSIFSSDFTSSVYQEKKNKKKKKK